MVELRKIVLGIGLILLAIGSYSAYTGYTESKQLMAFGAGQTTSWVFGNGPLYGVAIETQPTTNHDIQLTQEEVAKYPTLKAYIDYLDANGVTPHGSRSIDPAEARKLLLFLSQKASYEVKPAPDSFGGECYSVMIVLPNVLSSGLPGTLYTISILFTNNPPVFD